MDDVADLVQDSVETMALYDVHHMTDEMMRLTDLSVKCCERVRAADHVMRMAMSKFFREEPDVRELTKLKAIYELLETITDRCEDVANFGRGCWPRKLLIF